MKKLLLVVGLAVCMVGIAKAELFTNPGFEDGLTGWDDWGSGSGNGIPWNSGNVITVIQDGTAHSGDSHAESVWPLSSGEWSGYSMLYQQPWVTPGATYRFSAWVRDGDSEPGGSGSIQIEMSFEQRNWDGDTSGGAWRGEETEPRVYVFFDIPSDGQWHQVSYDHTVPMTVNQLGSLITIGSPGIPIDLDDYSLAVLNISNPQPPDGSNVPITLDALGWDNPNPNDPLYPLTSVVYFTLDYPEAGLFEGDPNFTDFADSIPVNEDNVSASIPEALVVGETYYWSVHSTDPNTQETFIGPVWTFTTDNSAPDVEAGDDVSTYLVAGTAVANLNATVSDDNFPNPPGAYTLSWAVTGGIIFPPLSFDDSTVEDPEVTATAAGTYILTLTANDSALSASDTVTVTVYEDGCEAAKAGGVPLLVGDVNEDCSVNFGDVALVAADWLMCISLDCL